MNHEKTLQVLTQRVERLEAKLMIHELLGQYGRVLDDWDEEGMRKVIAPDVIARHDAVAPPFEGIDTLIKVMRAARPKVQALQHYITNIHVAVHEDGDHATARAFVFAMHDTGVTQDGALLPAGGAYRMEVKRADTEYGWQIAEIEVTETWFDPRVITDIYEMSPMRSEE